MQFQDPSYPSQACTCCHRIGQQLSRTYQRCRDCYNGCPARGSCTIDPVPVLASAVLAGKMSAESAIRSLL